MKKNIANILTSVRIVISIILLTFSDFTQSFLVLFFICGATDLIDGPIARATGSQNTFGAKLDTTGDVLTYLALAKILTTEKIITLKTLLYFLIPLSGMLVSAFIAKLKFDSFVLTHTILAKLLGAGCFFLPFLTFRGDIAPYLRGLWVLALLAGIDMIAIQLYSNHAVNDMLFFSCVKKSNTLFNENPEGPALEESVCGQ